MLKNRLKEVRKYLKIGSQKDFATSLNWAIGRVQDLESGKVKELKASEAEEIQEKFLIDGWWLLTGKGQMVVSQGDNLPVAREKEQIKPANTLKNHIGDREMEIITAFRELSADKQELYYHKIKAEALEERLKNQPESPSDAKYA